MSEAKFKVGDRVRVLQDEYKNTIGTIFRVFGLNDYYRYEVAGLPIRFAASDLELLTDDDGAGDSGSGPLPDGEGLSRTHGGPDDDPANVLGQTALSEDVRFQRAVVSTYLGARDLLLKKHHDYGPLNISHAPGGPLNGLRVRLHDKMARINHLVDSGAEPENESLADSFMDMLNYSAIALLVLRGDWPS